MFPTDYIALYSYSSVEPGDLTFTEGEEILVTQKDGEWWTGSIGERTGIFPSNYVRPKDQEVMLFALNKSVLLFPIKILASTEICGWVLLPSLDGNRFF